MWMWGEMVFVGMLMYVDFVVGVVDVLDCVCVLGFGW